MGRAYQNRKDSMAKTSDAKAKVYSKYGREIYVCAKSGGVEPEGNLALRNLIDRAKKDQVPSHVIQKALDKAKGGGGENFAAARYEGFGPGGSSIIIDCLTDNPNRTYGDIRTCFNKAKCKIGVEGSVSHGFDHSAILCFKGEDEDAALEALMEADVDVMDIECDEGNITVFAPHTDYFKAKQALMDSLSVTDFEVDAIQFVPQNTSEISVDDVAALESLVDALTDLEDVQNVYHNAEF